MSTTASTADKSAGQQKINHDQLRLSAMLVAMVAPFMGKSDPRHYLNGINVRPHPNGGAIIAASNGHVLGAVHDKLATCEHEVTLHLASGIVTACRAHQGDKRELVLLKGRLAVVHGHQEVCIQAGDPLIEGGTFPNYESLIPDPKSLKPGLSGHFQAKYIAKLQDAIKVIKKAGYTHCPVTFYHVPGNESSYGIARTPALEEFIAILMQCREEQPESGVPRWVAGVAKKAHSNAQSKEAA